MKKFSISVVINGLEAHCNGLYDIESNQLKVLSGSKVRKTWSPNFKYFAKRNAQIKEYCIEKDSNVILQKDVTFESPTAAAKFCMGYEVNGMLYWKTTDNVKLKDYLKK